MANNRGGYFGAGRGDPEKAGVHGCGAEAEFAGAHSVAQSRFFDLLRDFLPQKYGKNLESRILVKNRPEMA